MSDARSIQTRRATWPLMSIPRIARACASASSGPAGPLMPPARQHLCLDHHRRAEPLGRLARLLGGVDDLAVRHGDPEPAEELLALVLVQIHRPRASRCGGPQTGSDPERTCGGTVTGSVRGLTPSRLHAATEALYRFFPLLHVYR